MRRWLEARLTLTIAWVGCFFGTHLPVPAEVSLADGRDKILHLIGYGCLSGLLCFQQLARVPSVAKAIWQTLVLILVYGAVDELTQPWVGRSAEWGDYAMDLIGASLAISSVAWFFVRSRLKQ